MKLIPTTYTTLSKIKTRSRELRSQYPTLGNARDAAAKEFGYESYHYAHQAALQTARSAQSKSHTGHPDSLIALAIARLPEILRRDPGLLADSEERERRFRESAGLAIAVDEIKTVQIEGGETYFADAVRDDLAFTRESGYEYSTEFAIPNQVLVARSIWRELSKPENDIVYRDLFDCTYRLVVGGYMALLQEDAHSPVAETNRALSQFMIQLLDAKTQEEAFDRIVHFGDELLPRSMHINIHTGEQDYSNPSTYWSRSTARISIEMCGTVANLPLRILNAMLSEGKADGPLPFFTIATPSEPTARRFFEDGARAKWIQSAGRR